MSKNRFVFVVCGAKEHIDTLHFSLEYLKKYSKNELWILTDSSRNEIPVQHTHIIDIQTPTEFNHHQASIYLKTGIHRFFPKGNKYCYLDTDIITLSEDVDKIFEEYTAPITFAPDHCKMGQFSPYAVNCECQNLYNTYNDKIEQLLIKIDPLRVSSKPSIIENRKKLVAYYQENNSFIKKILIGLKFVSSLKKFTLTEGIIFDKVQKKWRSNDGEVFMSYFKWSSISKQSGLKWNQIKSYPQLPDGRSLWSLECNHLQTGIQNKFNINVIQSNFQHWNGGVFLFDDSSHDFLETWFQSTMEIFKDPYWKTRDQGTLIKTVWQFGLQNHPTLNKRWNLIADYHNPSLKWEGNKIRLSSNELYDPVLLHVYHHFGDETWNFWNLIPKLH